MFGLWQLNKYMEFCMNNIYATPQADLDNTSSSERIGGSPEQAIAGNIEISMTGTLGEAWKNLKGFKTLCHISFLIYFIAAIIAALLVIPIGIAVAALGFDKATTAIIVQLLQMVASIATMPMFMAIHIMGIRHAANKPSSASAVFHYFNKIPALLLCYIMMIPLIILGLLLFILPGIYLMVAYMYSLPLIVEKNMSPWQALEVSRKALTRKWFPVFGLLLILLLVNILAIFTLGIAYIWVIPWSVLTMSMVHIKLFGAEAHTLAE
jgi:hypothetical protein